MEGTETKKKNMVKEYQQQKSFNVQPSIKLELLAKL